MTTASEPGGSETSLGDLAYERVRDLVVRGGLRPGERITERALRAHVALGASPVRDALARLDNEGLVITLPRRGYQVAPLTLQSIADVFDVWRVIGPAIVALAYQRQGRDGMTALRAQLEASMAADDTPVEAARKAWTGICLATENSHWIDTFLRLELHLARILFLTVDHLTYVPGPGLGRHHSIMDALQLDDVDEVARQTVDFIDEFRDEVLDAIRTLPSVTSAELSFGSPAGTGVLAGDRES